MESIDMGAPNPYNRDEVVSQLMTLAAKLENSISPVFGAESENDMPKRLAQKLLVDGKERWVHGYSVQELFDNYVKLLVKEGIVEMVDEDDEMPNFGTYLNAFYETFKQKQQSNTVINRKRIIRNHIEPAFGGKRLDRIRTTDIQRWFNSLAKTYSKETILKIKNIISPVFDAAVEDDIIDKNPAASKRIEIHGKETVHHKAIPKDKMAEIRGSLPDIPDNERLMAGLLSYSGLRFEEVLGLRWDDICDEWITVQRAVVHPKRNLPEVKPPKTKTSLRKVPLCEDLKRLLDPLRGKGFILNAGDPEKPLTYTMARRLFDKIRKRFNILEFTAHDFRDTCATEWRENGIPLDVISRMLGHSKTETTEKRYVKYRTDMMEKAKEKMG